MHTNLKSKRVQPTRVQQTSRVRGSAIVEGAVGLGPRNLPVPPQDVPPQEDTNRRHDPGPIEPAGAGKTDCWTASALHGSLVSPMASGIPPPTRYPRRRDAAGSNVGLSVAARVTGLCAQRRTGSKRRRKPGTGLSDYTQGSLTNVSWSGSGPGSCEQETRAL